MSPARRALLGRYDLSGYEGARRERMTDSQRMLVRTLLAKQSLGRPRRRWEDITNTALKQAGCEYMLPDWMCCMT
jgi:hypothetical protein